MGGVSGTCPDNVNYTCTNEEALFTTPTRTCTLATLRLHVSLPSPIPAHPLPSPVPTPPPICGPGQHLLPHTSQAWWLFPSFADLMNAFILAFASVTGMRTVSIRHVAVPRQRCGMIEWYMYTTARSAYLWWECVYHLIWCGHCHPTNPLLRLPHPHATTPEFLERPPNTTPTRHPPHSSCIVLPIVAPAKIRIPWFTHAPYVAARTSNANTAVHEPDQYLRAPLVL